MALDLTSTRPTLYIASTAGVSVACILERIAASDPALRVVDTHPLGTADPNGVDILLPDASRDHDGFITIFQVRACARPGAESMDGVHFSASRSQRPSC